jgi:hypothetical protein
MSTLFLPLMPKKYTLTIQNNALKTNNHPLKFAQDACNHKTPTKPLCAKSKKQTKKQKLGSKLCHTFIFEEKAKMLQCGLVYNAGFIDG